MSDERPKPSDDVIKWYEKATLTIDVLEKEIKNEIEEKKFWENTLPRISSEEVGTRMAGDVWLVEKDLRERGKSIDLKTKKVELLQVLKEKSGICPQCGGYGKFDRFESLRSGFPLNSLPRCDRCWGSGWKEGNKNPFDAITHAIMEKLD